VADQFSRTHASERVGVTRRQQLRDGGRPVNHSIDSDEHQFELQANSDESVVLTARAPSVTSGALATNGVPLGQFSRR
jgi:hypothetical protein